MSDIFSIDNEYIAHTYGRFPVAFTDGKGARLVDTAGKEYIDLGSGSASCGSCSARRFARM